MVKKSLLLTLLLALLVPWAANAYNHQVQVGNGTSGQNIAPINLYYNYSYTQQIYTAAQINGDCSLPGTIESISFYYAGSVTKTHPITVFMKTTDKTSFSSNTDWETVTADDIVYDANWTVSTAGWVTITLNEPFAYDGQSNLLIAIDKGYGDQYANLSFNYTAVTNNQVIHYRSDSTNPDPYSPTTATGTSANLPNIQFNMTIAHPAPSALTLDEVVINTATISWTAPTTTNTITGYAYEYTDGETIETGTTTGTTANLTELTAATDYLFQVKAIYSDGESCWSEAFDFTTMEACMTPENLSITNVTAHTADLTWTEGFGDGQWVLQYKLSTETEYTNSVNVALADLPYTLTGLTAESTYNVLIAPVCDDTKTITDNFTTTVACFAPTNLAVEANVQTATFTWVSDVNNYEIAHATVATADPIDNIVGTATENTYSMSDLTLADHYFWVRSNCGSEGYSSWAGPASVHIGYCVPAPANVDGNGISNVTFGMGDNIVNNDTPKATYADYTNQTGAVQAGVESTIAITYATGYTYGTIIWVDFDNSLSFEDSEIVYTGTSTSNNPTTLEATFIIPATQTPGDYVMRIGGADSGFDSYISGSSSTAPSACYTGNWACFQDYTLRVLEAPSCLTPTGLTASDVTAHEATISWTSDASAWEIQLDEEEAIEVTEATYTFTGLTAETEYSVKVRTNCSGTYSDWTNAISFTTTIACPAPTGLAFTLTPGDGTVATFSWTENGSATAWQLCINGDEDNLIDMDENPFTYNGFTPEETYTAKVRAVCGGIDGESAWSNTVTFTPTDAYTLTVNDGTTTNSYVPVYGTWVDSYTKCQFIIPASELVDMQYGNINKMTFYSSTANKTWGAAEFDILLTEVNNTTFESTTLVDWADMDQVYHGAVSISDYKMEIVFDNDYQYMGGNLLVGFHQTVKGTYSGISWYGVSSTNSAIGGYESNAKGLSIQNFLPKTTFAYEPGEEPTCIKPTNLAVEYTGGTEAIVSWNSEATAWNMRVNGVEVNGVITNPYTLTGLELATTYAVEVQANCGDNGVSDWTTPVSFTTDLCLPENMCEITITLTDAYGDGGGKIEVVDVLTEEVLGTYTCSGGSSTYTLAVCDGRELNFVYTNTDSYAYENGFVFTDVNGEVIAEHVGCSSSGCTPPTNGVVATYTVSCTVNPCRVPTDLATSEISTFKADLSWTGYHDAYNLQYRHPAAADPNATTATVILTAGDVWGDGSGYQMLLDADATAYGTIIPVSGALTSGGDVSEETYAAFEYKIPGNADGSLTTENIVIDSSITIQIPAGTYDWCITNPTSGDRMWIAATNGNVGGRYDDFVFEAGMTYEFTVSMHGENDGVDVTITPMDEWILVENLTDPSYNLTGLDAKTMYEWQVQGISDDCENGVTEWSAINSFFTDKAYYWNDPQTWTNDTVPAAYTNVTIPANTTVVIPNDYTAYANEISFEEGASIFIEDGGQLYHSNEIPVTLQLNYESGLDAKSGETEYGDYRLIAAPITPGVPVSSTGLVPDINDTLVDLYYFDQAAGELVWINYKDLSNGFDSLYIAKGYLYSNAQNVMGIFAGNTLPTTSVSVALDYTEGMEWAGWNLVGNPFTCMAYINLPYFKINDEGNAIASIEGNSLEIFEGVFVEADPASGIDSVEFYTITGTGIVGGDPIVDLSKGNLVLNLSHNSSALVDRAIVRFDEGRQLPKLQINANQSTVYIPMDGVDYAIANATEMGEMPVSFKAESNGTYNLSIAAEEVSFNYLHLIDNMTGADVDLLATPSYSFNAKTTDYASRFKLVYATGNNNNNNNNDNFAFMSNGNLVINNEGMATVQVIDVTGRIVKSESINGSANVNVKAAAGVYMLRLVNGDNVKVQKVVIE